MENLIEKMPHRVLCIMSRQVLTHIKHLLNVSNLYKMENLDDSS